MPPFKRHASAWQARRLELDPRFRHSLTWGPWATQLHSVNIYQFCLLLSISTINTLKPSHSYILFRCLHFISPHHFLCLPSNASCRLSWVSIDGKMGVEDDAKCVACPTGQTRVPLTEVGLMGLLRERGSWILVSVRPRCGMICINFLLSTYTHSGGLWFIGGKIVAWRIIIRTLYGAVTRTVFFFLHSTESLGGFATNTWGMPKAV